MNQKESVRKTFRSEVFRRDKFVCKICGYKPEKIEDLDCHHIINRFFMPHQGNTPSNGITLCTDRSSIINCHEKAEFFHKNGYPLKGFSPSDLYKLIESSYEKAFLDSLNLGETKDNVKLTLSLVDSVKNQEIVICNNFGFEKSYTTWLLACEQLNVVNKFVINYKKEYI